MGTGARGVAACGSDPVCAGVSALLYGYLAFAEELLPETGGSLEAEEREGFLRIKISCIPSGEYILNHSYF